MTHPILSRIPILRAFVDERFLEHRRRASSIAGFATLLAAAALFEYRYFVDHVFSWDLLAVIVVFAVVKISLFIWYWIHD
ncbi:MAG: hypothetical protein ABSC48_01550 [Terracidiphilus sp.]|jgi:membrane protein YdbS with pleckstrin-like domain